MGATIAGSHRRLERLAGANAVPALVATRAALAHILSERLCDRPVLGHWRALIEYLNVTMAHRRTEQVRLLHLNSRNVLIRDEALSEGTIDKATLHLREVISRCLELGTAGIIIAHNHPSGDPEPSRADIETTRAIADAADKFGIVLHDHIIVGAMGHVSMRTKGWI